MTTKEQVKDQEVNHKGTFCPYNNETFCQEGYCWNCEIYPLRNR